MDLEKLVNNYHPPEAAIQAIERNNIALLVGISGAGKDTIKRELLRLPDFGQIVSHTTRAPRENAGVMEQDGQDYHFIDEATAESMLKNGEFIEAKLVHGTVYGTSIASVEHAAKQGVAITDIDVQGVAEYKAVSDKVIAIFIIPPNYDEWLQRLRRRYSTEEEFLSEWPKRRASALRELQRALELPYYHCVMNDDLARAAAVVADIAQRSDKFTRKDDEVRLQARKLLEDILSHS